MEEKELTHAQKSKIYKAIGSHMAPDDRYPYEVIRDDFNGDEDAYLRRMAGWHNVNLD